VRTLYNGAGAYSHLSRRLNARTMGYRPCSLRVHTAPKRHSGPTYAGLFDRLTKPQIIKAVEEGASREAVLRLAGPKRSQMGHDAELLLAATRWLPEPLRNSKRERSFENEAPDEAASDQNCSTWTGTHVPVFSLKSRWRS